MYTEQMMLDQGYGDGDLSLRLHQLKFYLRAVINAILDHKMHCANMTDEEAMKLLIERGFQTEGEAVGKIAAGEAELDASSRRTSSAARRSTGCGRHVQRKQGEAFDLGKYHEAVLSHGTLPVKYLPELGEVGRVESSRPDGSFSPLPAGERGRG